MITEIISEEAMYHFIINPNSRSGAGARIWSELQSVLDKNYIPYKAYFTEYPGHAVKLAASVCSSDAAPYVLAIFPPDPAMISAGVCSFPKIPWMRWMRFCQKLPVRLWTWQNLLPMDKAAVLP